MRKYLVNTRTNGKLFLNNKIFTDNAELEFEDNYYTNYRRSGKIKLENLSTEFEKSFRNNKYQFKFIDSDNRSYFGKIIGFQHKSEIQMG